MDNSIKNTLTSIPLLKLKVGPREKDQWPDRLKEEYCSLIKYVENNKKDDNDWFRLESNADGTKWWGKCWFVHELLKYEFDLCFDIPVTYPSNRGFIFNYLRVYHKLLHKLDYLNTECFFKVF